MSRRTIRKPYIVLIFLSILAVNAFILIAFGNYLGMKKHYTFSNVSGVFFGDYDKYLVIDNGRTSIEIINKNNQLTRQKEGEKSSLFYYADNVIQHVNKIYISDSAYSYDEDENIILEKRIVLLDRSIQKVLFSKSYKMNSASENVADDILDMLYYKDHLYFLLDTEYGLALYSVDSNNQTEIVEKYYLGENINDASYDPVTGNVAVTVKRGFIRVWNKDDKHWKTLTTTYTPFPDRIVFRDGRIFYSNLSNNAVYETELDSKYDATELFTTKSKIVSLERSEDGSKLIAGNENGYYEYENGNVNYTGSVPFKYYYVSIALRFLLVIEILMLLIVVTVFFRFLKTILVNENSIRVVLVVVAVIIVTCFVAFPLLSNSYKNQDDNKITNMKLFAELLCSNIDPSNLAMLSNSSTYGGSAYVNIKEPLDVLVSMAANDGVFYYYTIYDIWESDVFSLLDSRDTIMCGAPYDGNDKEHIRKCFLNDYSFAVNALDTDGNWLSVYVPIYDNSGAIRAVLRLRSDMGLGIMQKRSTFSDTIINVLCTTAVVMMLILEGVLLISFSEKKRNYGDVEKKDVAVNIPLRTLIFFTNAADSMQDAIFTLLAIKLYDGQLPVSESVGVALPISAQLLMLAIFSGFSARMGEKRGHCRVIGSGLLIQCLGCILCVVTGTYFGLLFGKCFIGAGMGMVYVNCYALAAKGSSETSSAKAFTRITAGSLSGVTIGAGLSSVFFTLGGWKAVYIAAASILVISVAIAKVSVKYEEVALGERITKRKVILSREEAGKVKEEKSIHFKQFFTKRVFSFLMLIVLPFMMALAYREYFLPLIASMNGITEVTIARYYLVCGLVFLYTGPTITNVFMERLGALKSVFLSCILLGFAILLYVFLPLMPVVFLAVLILSFVTSFAYACLYTYFGKLPESLQYGESKAMGVYSVFESIGSTLGPLFYGFLLSFGIKDGISKIGIMILVFSLGYMVLFGHKKKEKPE